MTKKVYKKKQKMPKKGETTRGRQLAFIEAYTGNRFNISGACRSIGIGRSTFYKWQKLERFCRLLDDAVQEKIDLVEAALFRNAQSGDPTSIIFFLKTAGKSRGYIEAEKIKVGEAPAKIAVEILDQLISGDIDAVTASLRFSREGLPLPETLRLLLTKATPPEPPPELPPSLDDAELEAGYLKEMSRIDKQEKEWLAARRIEIQEIKDELKEIDSFKLDAKNQIRRSD